ncbi:Carboxypeptidase O [Camelus dromedarius]|uniref:Carboxypeptidase O n=1 Tax=Camelus dromedarius TaxID=9838 RepID=A0A5N4E4Z4_CAMDR|nr:Carboxypeptidase O [Camelus dromedarius]
MLVPGGLGYDRSLAQHRQEVVDEIVSPWRSLETYSYNRYHPMEEIYQWMSQIREKYTEVVTQHFLGMTYESRPMYCLKLFLHQRESIISRFIPTYPTDLVADLMYKNDKWGEEKEEWISQPSNNPKKIIWMDCGIHAREWIAPAFCQWFVKEILQNYKDNSRIRRLLKNLDFYVLPVLNIDGYIYTWTTVSLSSLVLGWVHELDLDLGIGASHNCQELTFCGTGPVSEPETKAVSSFIESKKENIVCFLTMHSYGQLILLPYGYTTNKPSNHEELDSIGQCRTRKGETGSKTRPVASQTSGELMHLTASNSASMFAFVDATSGSSRDWAQDIGIPFSYTFELRDNGTYGFVLPEAQIQATCEEAMEAVLSVLDDVYEKYWHSNSAEKATSTAVVLSLLMSFISLL